MNLRMAESKKWSIWFMLMGKIVCSQQEFITKNNLIFIIEEDKSNQLFNNNNNNNRCKSYWRSTHQFSKTFCHQPQRSIQSEPMFLQMKEYFTKTDKSLDKKFHYCATYVYPQWKQVFFLESWVELLEGQLENVIYPF